MSDKFRRFSMKCARLHHADVLALTANEVKAFWFNVYHLLYLHSYILVGPPHSKLIHRGYLFNSFSYKIGANTYSLKDIEELFKTSLVRTRNLYFSPDFCSCAL